MLTAWSDTQLVHSKDATKGRSWNKKRARKGESGLFHPHGKGRTEDTGAPRAAISGPDYPIITTEKAAPPG